MIYYDFFPYLYFMKKNIHEDFREFKIQNNLFSNYLSKIIKNICF